MLTPALEHRLLGNTAKAGGGNVLGHALDDYGRTGDGCFESVVLDPDGHRIEIGF